ncbi:hypothetical protein MBOVa_1460 [Mycoplasmopsis bovis 8790]|nr:hypothetical protein MBOVa_1460 [Mycoplasmopsis bovis 8790]
MNAYNLLCVLVFRVLLSKIKTDYFTPIHYRKQRKMCTFLKVNFFGKNWMFFPILFSFFAPIQFCIVTREINFYYNYC